ncbi:hypothetical protein E2C01_048476 [Portunus trituberculatus]|uniref:Uncharacterized protein n=1 Tax=Portunus trituberculatus TaxID=210409 RepID=A0A5B7GB49_PORTR|nr:hypothetical protein [Portunus trituberculatus]
MEVEVLAYLHTPAWRARGLLTGIQWLDRNDLRVYSYLAAEKGQKRPSHRVHCCIRREHQHCVACLCCIKCRMQATPSCGKLLTSGTSAAQGMIGR